METTREGSNDPPVISQPFQRVPPQINSSPPPRSSPPTGECAARSTGLLTGFIVLSALALLFVVAVVGVTGYFRLNSETAALRKSAMAAVPGVWDKKVAVRVGWFTTALIRTGSRFFNMPPEPRAALDAVHGVDVGVYTLQQDPAPEAFKALLTSADHTMKSYGWDRIVGASKEGQFVGVYFPHRKVSLRGVRCCVVVFQGRDLVVASASGNLEPLLKLADAHMDMSEVQRQLRDGIRL